MKERLFVAHSMGPEDFARLMRKLDLPLADADLRPPSALDKPRRVSASGQRRFTVGEVDLALSRFQMEPTERLTVKKHLEVRGLL